MNHIKLKKIMAKPDLLIPHILYWEGGFVDDPDDRGGATNKGVTIGTFRQYFGRNASVSALKHMTDSQWRHIYFNGFWNKWRASEIENQSIANIVVDWGWHSGAENSIQRVQRLFELSVDGIVGPITLSALNDNCARATFNKIKSERLQFFDSIVKSRPSQKKFLRGWRNRVNSIHFKCTE